MGTVEQAKDAEGNYRMTEDGRYLYNSTDWQDAIYRTAISTDHNLTIAGGLKDMPYRVSLGYTNQQGILKTSDFERYTASVNLSPSFLDNHLKFNLNAKGMIAKSTYADGGAIGAANAMDPTQPIYSEDEIHQNTSEAIGNGARAVRI